MANNSIDINIVTKVDRDTAELCLKVVETYLNQNPGVFFNGTKIDGRKTLYFEKYKPED